MFHETHILKRLILPVSIVLAFAVFTACSLAQEEQTEQKTGTLRLKLTLLPTAPAGENQTATEENKKDENVSVTAADAEKKKQQEAQAAMQKVMEQAQKAYEEEKRKLKERLEKDPQWQATHKQCAVIEVSEKSNPTEVHTFCLSGEGNLLVGCGGVFTEEVDGSGPNEHAESVNGVVRVTHTVQHQAPTEIRIYTPEGKKIEAWKIETEPQAICVGGDGTIFVGGAGKLIKLDKTGKVLMTADVPNAAELSPPALESDKKAESAEEADAAKKARKEKIAELQKKMDELSAENSKIIEEARKDLKPEDADSVKAFQEKIQGPRQKYTEAVIELSAAQKTPEMLALEAQQARKQKMEITGIAVSGNDVFLACPMTKTYGYAVWRTDQDFGNPKKIIENLAGCCGQMDIQAKNGEFWVAHNGKHLVEHFDRDGKKLSSFGKTDRTAADGFGGCCEPKNLRFGPENVLYACESGPPTCVKRFSTDGKFLNVAAVAPWDSGCVRVTTEVNGDGSRLFVLNNDANAIHVFTEKKAETPQELQKLLADARKKMAEAKAQFDDAKAKLDEAKKKLDEARKDMVEASKKMAEPAQQNRLVIRGIPLTKLGSGTLTLSNKAVADAQKTYEEQKRAEQERLKNDPKWRTSHEPGAVIKVDKDSKNSLVHTFCLNGDGNLLVGCSIFVRNDIVPLEKPGNVNANPIRSPEIRILSPDGAKIDSWKLDAEPQAICLGEGGTVFVGGAGKLIKLDKDGKVLLTADVPNAAELPKPTIEPEKKADPEEDAEAAKKAREAKIAELQKTVTELSQEYSKLVQEARKDLKQGDADSLKAFQEKIQEPQQKLMAASQELAAARLTPELRAFQAQQAWLNKMAITSIAVSGEDIFLACPMTKTYGFAVWRTDLNFGNPTKIIESLSGCCGQMDIKVRNGEVWVAHNAKHKVEKYDRDGKQLSSFGKTDRINADGFGGCCEPKNLRFGPEGELYACESGPPTCVKRFSTDGEFIGMMAIAPWTSGCVRVTTEVNVDGSKFFVLHSDENTIQVFNKKKAEAVEKTPESGGTAKE